MVLARGLKRMKAILIVDMPSDCAECEFCGFGGRNLEKYVCCLTREHSEEPHLVGCPLKPMPEKMKVTKEIFIDYACLEKGYECGWNACLEELEK